ncbi:MAG: lipoprotein-releasing ABC transporter permease subunit [Pseudomonadota bacterium]
MSVETFIGWRYLKAKRKQAFISLITIISLAGVAVGVTAMIVVLAVMNGFEDDLKSKILGVNAHIVVLRRDKPMIDYLSLLPRVEAVDGTATVEPFIHSQVILSAVGGSAGTILHGVDPVRTAVSGHLGRSLIKGKLAALESSEPPGIILGSELASQLGALPGDAIKVISPLGQVTPLGGRAPRVKKFTLVGLFETGMYEYDSTFAYVSIKEAQDFLNLGPGVTGLEVKARDVYRADVIREKIMAELGPDYWGKDWMQMNKNLFSALKLEKTAMFVILILTVLVAAFNIASSQIMVVMEKTRDIAILKAMGAARNSIMRIFVFQGFFIGASGALAGLAGGLALCKLLAKYKFVQLPSDVYYITTLPVKLEFFDVALILFSALLISLLATLYPAWQAGRLDPVEALRYE